MNIMLAADGSRYTKKALAFIVANENLRAPAAQLVVLNVQPPLPPHVTKQVGKAAVGEYYRELADKVLEPIRKLLDKRGVACRTEWVIGAPHEEIIRAAQSNKAHMIVMGTHGHGLFGRIVLGSVAQRVVADSPVPVLLVK